MLDKLRRQFATYLSQRQVCLLSTAAGARPATSEGESAEGGAWAMPVRYHPLGDGLEVDCLLPCWADVTYHLEQDPRVLLVIQMDEKPGFFGKTGFLKWLQVLGAARALSTPDWPAPLPEAAAAARPEDLYRVVRVRPTRLDLFDESRGWGVRETLEVVG